LNLASATPVCFGIEFSRSIPKLLIIVKYDRELLVLLSHSMACLISPNCDIVVERRGGGLLNSWEVGNCLNQ